MASMCCMDWGVPSCMKTLGGRSTPTPPPFPRNTKATCAFSGLGGLNSRLQHVDPDRFDISDLQHRPAATPNYPGPFPSVMLNGQMRGRMPGLRLKTISRINTVHLYGETRNAVEVDCIDCHGTIRNKATLSTSAAAAPEGGSDLSVLRTPWGQRRFFWSNGHLYQRSMLDKDRSPWEVVQVSETITPGNPHYNEKSRYAKTLRRDGTISSPSAGESELAHANSKMTCYACHSSWTTSCFGCHLPMIADLKTRMLHNEGLATRNYVAYNFEVLRNDIYMLGIDSTVKNHRVAPTRSTCAVVVSSQNANRDWIY